MSAILQWYYAVLAASKKVVAVDWWLSGGINPVNAIAAYQPKGASSQAASYSNLANPALYNAAPGVAPTWTPDDGWIGNGTTQFLTTGISVNGGSFSVLVRFTFAGAGFGRLVGTSLAANTNPRGLIVPNSGAGRIYGNGAGLSFVGTGVANGVMAFAGNRAYYNGADEGVTLAGWSGTNNNGLYIFAQNEAGSPTNVLAARIQAIAIYNTPLTAAQVLAVTQAMQAL